MFSTVDSVGARYVKIYVETADGQFATALTAAEPDLLFKIESAPALPEIQRLASRLASANSFIYLILYSFISHDTLNY